MRTKTLLLSAAALAAGLLSSQAQNVYSANVVGYATYVIHGGATAQFTLLSNPFNDGNANTLTNIVDPQNNLGKQSEVLTWDPANQVYDIDEKTGSPLTWQNPTLSLPPGTGFFVRNGNTPAVPASITNTIVGSVITPNGSSVTNQIAPLFSLQGSPIPYNGNLAYLGQAGGDTNENFGAAITTKQSEILTWDVVNQVFDISEKTGSPLTWNATVSNYPTAGFFTYLKTGGATNVVETLNLQ